MIRPRNVEGTMNLSLERMHRTNVVASVVYHIFIVCGEVGVLLTILTGISTWTVFAAFLLWLAGFLTLVYPHVGTHPRFAAWVWGRRHRSLMPWVVMFWLLLACFLQTIVVSAPSSTTLN
jgi:hypothetical protein